jgi:hypothetical protein
VATTFFLQGNTIDNRKRAAIDVFLNVYFPADRVPETEMNTPVFR